MPSVTWANVFQLGSKDRSRKTGLNPTKYKDHALNGVTRPAQLSEELPILGIRASDTIRIFGAQSGNTFMVLWFDLGHNICSS